jgi:hypothetical protein
MADDPFELSQEETQVMLGRYAGASVPELSRSTGIAPARVQAIVARLTEIGLLGDETPEPEPVVTRSAAPPAGASARPAQASQPPPAGPSGRPAQVSQPAPVVMPIEHHAGDDLVALLDAAIFDLLLPSGGEPPRALPPGPIAARPLRRTPAVRHPVDDEPPPAPPEEEPEPPPTDEDRAATAAELAEDTREYRKLYEMELKPLPLDERVALAGKVTGARLAALCFDPVPAVIAALFLNSATSVEHARLIAFHHRDPRGLDEVAGRPALLADPLVHRRLVRNPAVTEPMIRKLLGNRRLAEVYKTSLDRDVPERSRSAARTLMRTRWSTGQAEERVDLVMSTEGRVLMVLTGMTFDSRMTSILCSRSYTSIMLIQCLARFPATPPQLLVHLLRQPMVKRQLHLRNAILQHQNTPSDAKRKA